MDSCISDIIKSTEWVGASMPLIKGITLHTKVHLCLLGLLKWFLAFWIMIIIRWKQKTRRRRRYIIPWQNSCHKVFFSSPSRINFLHFVLILDFLYNFSVKGILLTPWRRSDFASPEHAFPIDDSPSILGTSLQQVKVYLYPKIIFFLYVKEMHLSSPLH